MAETVQCPYLRQGFQKTCGLYVLPEDLRYHTKSLGENTSYTMPVVRWSASKVYI